MVSDLAAAGVALDDVVVQVGGGALGTAVADAFEEAGRFGVLERQPRFHTVQTESAWPLKRAYDLVAARVSAEPGLDAVRAAMAYAGSHRAEFMWPWETVPHSIAHGILDDETYDWLAVVEAMLRTGGVPVVAGEDELAVANALATMTTDIPVDATGSAGLAGALDLRRAGGHRRRGPRGRALHGRSALTGVSATGAGPAAAGTATARAASSSGELDRRATSPSTPES